MTGRNLAQQASAPSTRCTPTTREQIQNTQGSDEDGRDHPRPARRPADASNSSTTSRARGAASRRRARRPVRAHSRARRSCSRGRSRADPGRGDQRIVGRRRARHRSGCRKTDYVVAGESAGSKLETPSGSASRCSTRPACATSWRVSVVLGERHGHVRLDLVRHVGVEHGVHEEGKGQLVAIASLAVPHQVGHVAQRSGLTLTAWANVRFISCSRSRLARGTASDETKSMLDAIRLSTWRGVVKSDRDNPEPSLGCGCGTGGGSPWPWCRRRRTSRRCP